MQNGGGKVAWLNQTTPKNEVVYIPTCEGLCAQNICLY